MGSYMGSLDQGTSSTRFMIFDHASNVIASHQVEHRQIVSQPGWVEHDASEIWSKAQEVIRATLTKANLIGSDLLGIGITNQRETALIWDITTGKPLANAIVWQDTRTQESLASLPPRVSELIRERTGLPVASYFSASKFRWLMENSEPVRNALKDGRARAGTIDSWLLWNLTGGIDGGVHATDVTNASRTLLMNLKTLDWDQELLDIFNIPRILLPKIRSSSERYGDTDPSGPFGVSIPVAGILGDQQSALVGQTCFNRGESKTTYGTGNFALLNTGTEIVRSNSGLLTTVAFKMGNAPVHYALEGSVAVTGAAIQWLRDQIGLIEKASDVEALAASVSDTGDLYFVPAFSGLFAPYWHSSARGLMIGLTLATTRAHIARAALESICYQTKEILDAMIVDSQVPMQEMKVDGGITANELCMQLQADIMGISVIRPEVRETTALGAAYSAGLALGFWKDLDEIRSQAKASKTWKPQSSEEARAQGYARWKNAVERTFNWAQ
ncbi:MAG TPA: glycerol kinase GlpK [Candidatus Paceibacterota bacterium]|nr:glycerol kinase GlpK [Candidatus Paceibacterota bacterium]